MTWYDHKTGSVWSQPWGRALTGDLKGTQLRLIPFSLVPWGTWKAEHPETLALMSPDGRDYGRQRVEDNFVAGLALGDLARGYPYEVLAQEMVINDVLGDVPILVHTNPQTRSIHIYVRQLSDGTLLHFEQRAGTLVDRETGSEWDATRGVALRGELAGQGIRELPWISSFPWDWEDFYPTTDFYAE